MDDHVPDIRAQIEAGCAVVIVGAGATIASTGSPAFSWAGLLRAGAAEATKFISPDDRKDAWKARMDQALARGDLPSFLSVGDEIEKILRGTRELEYFLKRHFANIAIKDRRLWEAIDQLGCRIATTNYDDVGERITSRRSIVWNERQDVIEFVKGDDTTLLHFHGLFRDRKTVVLGKSSYAKHLRKKLPQFFQKLLPTLNTLVFIGFGEGMEDPNFSALMKWMKGQLKDSGDRHYRLCLDSQQREYDRQLPERVRIYNVSFGSSHAELPAFIETLVPKTAIPMGLREHTPLIHLANAHLAVGPQNFPGDSARGKYRNDLAAMMARYIEQAQIPFGEIMKTRHEGLRAGLARAIGKIGAADDINLLIEMAPHALLFILRHQILWGMHDLHQRHGTDPARLKRVAAALEQMSFNADKPLLDKIAERRSQLGLG